MGNQQQEIIKYLKLLIKRRYWFIAVSLVVMSIVVWGSFFIQKQYEAKSTVFIERNVIKEMVRGIALTPSSEDRIRVLKYALLSREFILKVLKELDLDTKTKNTRELENMIVGFQQKTNITIKNNDLFIVSLRDHDPKLAMNFINTLIRKYIEENVSSKRNEAYGANTFIVEQVKLYKDKLEKADQAIIEYRQKKGVYMSVDDRALINDIKNYQTEIDTLRIRHNEMVATRNSIKRQLKGEEPFTVSVLTRKQGGSADSQIIMREQRIKQLQSSYTDSYPEIIKLRAEIEALKSQPKSANPIEQSMNEGDTSTSNPIHQDLKQRMLQAEAEIDAIDAKMKQVGAVIARKEGELRNIPEGKKILANLEKERDAHRQVYDQLLSSQGKSDFSKQMEIEDKSTNFRIVDPAVVPVKPVSPDRVKLILLGIVAGIAAGFGAVILREVLDSTVKESKTFKEMGLEILAVIPRITNTHEDEKLNKRDRLIYILSASYFLIICLAFVHEFMELTLIESFISKFGFTI
jgi:polysaccharide chain length determinant protein (PEP-CTERM system associated)